MKIHNCVRDAKLMELVELQAIDKRAKAVQATTHSNESKQSDVEPQKSVETPQKARSKKKKEEV